MNLNFINQGKGIPFVFQHGLGANLMQTQKLFSDLLGAQLISVDCPGHGQSPYPMDQNPSFNYYAEQVLRVLDQLKIEKFILGGLSMGAGIALNIALRFPERIKALILLRPAWLDQNSPENLKILLDAASLIKTDNGKHLFSQNQQFQEIKNRLPSAADSIIGVFNTSQQTEIDKVLNYLVNDRPFNQLERLKSIELPTLIIANEDDPLHPFSMAKTLHQYLPNSSLHKVVSRYINNQTHREAIRELTDKFIVDSGIKSE